MCFELLFGVFFQFKYENKGVHNSRNPRRWYTYQQAKHPLQHTRYDVAHKW